MGPTIPPTSVTSRVTSWHVSMKSYPSPSSFSSAARIFERPRWSNARWFGSLAPRMLHASTASNHPSTSRSRMTALCAGGRSSSACSMQAMASARSRIMGLTRGKDTRSHHSERLDAGEVLVAQFTELTAAIKGARQGGDPYRRREGDVRALACDWQAGGLPRLESPDHIGRVDEAELFERRRGEARGEALVADHDHSNCVVGGLGDAVS